MLAPDSCHLNLRICYCCSQLQSVASVINLQEYLRMELYVIGYSHNKNSWYIWLSKICCVNEADGCSRVVFLKLFTGVNK